MNMRIKYARTNLGDWKIEQYWNRNVSYLKDKKGNWTYRFTHKISFKQILKRFFNI